MYFTVSGNGKPIVFLHGWGCDGQIFAPVARRLTDFTCYLADFDGFGASVPVSKRGKTVQDYADDLKVFLRQNGIVSPLLVGHSFGCRVAAVYSASNAENVRGIVMVAPAGIRRFNLAREAKISRYKICKALKKIGFTCNLSHGSADYAACPPELKQTFVNVVNADLSAYFRAICAPTLIVCGDADIATPYKDCAHIHRLIKGSGLVKIAGDHFAFFRSPAAFAQTVRIFAKSVFWG